MCLIISRNKQGIVDWQAADTAARRNPHGYGVSYANDSGLQVFKSMEWSDVRDVAMRLEFSDVPFILHMRFATHGAPMIDNCHPFKLESHDLAMMHNGMLWTIEVPEDECDSKVLANNLDETMAKGFLTNEVATNMIEGLLENASKLAFMDSEGTITIINEHLGEEVDGVWYSVPGTVARSVRTFNPMEVV